MEAQENDLPPSIPFRISGFPTLKFKPAGSKSFVDYEGERSFESLVSFVEEHAKNYLEVPILSEEHAQVPLETVNTTSDSEANHDEL